jgi:hypothetical protein
LSADDRNWLDLFKAVAARDAERMARLGERLAEDERPLFPALRAYALVASTVGYHVSGNMRQASAVLEKGMRKLPDATTQEPLFLVLRGLTAS